MILKKISKIPYYIFKTIVCNIRSFYYSTFINEGGGKFLIKDPFLRIKIVKERNSKLIIDGTVIIDPYLLGNDTVSIILCENSTFHIKGDFIIGDGVKISIDKNGILIIGGKDIESGAGITSNTIIRVNKKITIGNDFLCAWGVFISDSDWHSIDNQQHQLDVFVGNHVWIANNSSVLKGSIISDNSIVAGQSKLINKVYPPNVLIGGIPAKVIKDGISWSRDI